MTKEEIANIKRIDTSLNVFRKKIKALDEKKHKLVDPIITEMMALEEEINFWEKPVIERYGKHTWELLKEAGEQTAEETSAEEDEENISEDKSPIPEAVLESNKSHEQDRYKTNPHVKPMEIETPASPEECMPPEPHTEQNPSDDLPMEGWPEEWNN